MAAKAGTAYIEFEGDFSKLNRQVRAAMRPLAQQAGAEFSRDADRGFTSLNRTMARTRRGSEGLNNSMLRLKLVTGALAFGPAVSGLNGLAAGAVAAAGSLGPLIGSLAAVPAVAGAAAQALAAVSLGSAGVKDALKAANDTIVKSGDDATAALDRQRAAAEAVRSAKQALADAQRQAERAQRDLTTARKEGRRELEDMRLAADRSRSSERNAVLALKRARQELARIEIDPEARRLDVADARQRVTDAEQDLEATRVQARRERKDFEEARKRGVRGMPQVVSAREQLADSNRSVAEASHQVAVAQREATSAMQKQSSAATRYQQALSELSPAAQHFVETLMGYRPVLKDLQATTAQGLFPGVERGLAAASKNTVVFGRILGDTAQEMGGIAQQFGEFLGRGDVGRDIAVQGQRNAVTIRRFGDASLYLTDALRNVTLAAGPLVDWMTRMTVGWTRNIAESTRARRESGELAANFERTRFILERLISITGNVTSGLRGVFRAGRADGDRLWMSLDRLTKRFDDWANSVRGQNALREWFAEGRETLGQMADAIRGLRDRFRELRSEGRSGFDALAITLSEAIARAIGHAVEQIAHRAPAIAEAFVRGFLSANAWGKLAIGGWLLAKFGGMGAVKALGDRIAGGLSGGLTGGLPRGVSKKTPIPVWVVNQGPGTGGKPGGPKVPPIITGAGRALPLAGRLIPVIGATGLIYYIASRNAENNFPTRGIEAARERARVPLSPQVAPKPERVLGGTIGNTVGGKDESAAAAAAGADQLAKRIKAVRAEIARLRGGSITDVRGINRAATENFKQIRDNIGLHTGEGRKLAAANLKGAAKAIASSVASGKTSTKAGMSAIRDLLDDRSRSGRKALEGNFDDVIAVIHRTMRRGGKITDEGLALIRKAYVEQLRFYGFSPKQAINEARPGTRFDAGPEEGSRGPTGQQRGGPINIGKPSGDSVPAMLERGEYVLNRKAVQRLGRDKLDQINFGVAPRFQAGGIVELLHPFNDPAGHGGSNSHLHIAMRSIEALIALGRRLQRSGWLVGEHPAFGGIQGRHAPGGYHYTNQAIDVNWPNAAEEGAKIRALLPQLGGLATGDVEKLRRIVVSGSDSPLRTIVQGAMDNAVASAQARLDSLIPIEGAEPMTGSGDVESVFANVARRLSTSRVATLALGMAGYAESGMRDLPYGDSTSQGALQLLASTARGLGVDPHDEAAIASLFFTRGFYGRGGANALAAQGLPAHLVAQGVQGSAFASGSNYQAQRGRALAWMQRFGLREGGLVEMLQAGGSPGGSGRFGAAFGNAIKRIKSRFPKVRRRALKPLLERIKQAGVPAGIQSDLEKFAKDSEVFGDMASRANTLTDTDAITRALEAELTRRGGRGFPESEQQAVVESMLARVGGLTEPQWLHKQLEALFAWRNRIIEAEQIVVQRRDEITALIEQARDRVKRLTRLIRDTAKTRKRLFDRLEGERKKSRPNRALVRSLRARVMGLDELQRGRRVEQGAIREQILPALTEKREGLNTTRGELLSQLDTVQGPGSPMDLLPALPEVGVFGGDIFAVQTRLRDITRSSPRVTDTTTGPSEAESQRADILSELLRESRQRTGVSEAQFKVFRDFPPFGGAFAEGGVVPGPTGAPRMILAHGGETVVPPGDGGLNVTVIVKDGAVDPRKIETIVERKTRRDSRVRTLPGRAGMLDG